MASLMSFISASLFVTSAYAIPQAAPTQTTAGPLPTNASPDNVTIDSIVLTGFDGCDIIDSTWRAGIINGFKEMNTMVGGEENQYHEWQYYPIDWKSAAAIEAFGPGYKNMDYRDGVQKNMDQLATMDYAWWFGWRLHVRCDDPANICLCVRGSPTIAYTIHDDPYKNHINFCPKYFGLRSLGSAVETASGYAQYRDKIELYFNRAAAWAHEALHVSWLGTSVGISFPWMTDEEVESSDGSTSWAAYRSVDTKYLAFSDNPASFESVNNPQSYSYFALANYVQRIKGFYPSQSIWLSSDDPPPPPPNSRSPLSTDAFGEGNATAVAFPSDYCATHASAPTGTAASKLRRSH